ncbi:AI-2E family transporter YdiK [Pararobbsia silviterrae]|uniref:AI-2E family transporter YdiK n=1 Tax=Pararobbsia silviterrae TaxID=1792498 RepID=UPI001F0C3F5B|nr:AI-2E family transporter YdiK [Pararobbsia silviterrae]
MNRAQNIDLARNLLVIVILSALAAGSFYVMRPFIPGLIWAATIVIATWPLMLGLQHRLGNRRWLATAILLAGLVVVIVLPLYSAISTLAEHAADIMDSIKALPTYSLPPPPDWVAKLPLLGSRAASEWQKLSDAGPGGLLAKLEPYLTLAARWMLGHAAIVGAFVVHMCITIIIAGILYMNGEAAASLMMRFAARTAGERGTAAIRLTGLSIRAVALGIVVTAIAQSAIGGIGLWICGVPGAGILTAIMLMLCLAQIGPLPPLVGGIVYLFWHDAHVTGVVLIVITVLAAMLDNFLRPMLIRRGVDLPMLLILSGVLGGMFAFGIVGLFMGPVILAVTFTLLRAWIDEVPPEHSADPVIDALLTAPADADHAPVKRAQDV